MPESDIKPLIMIGAGPSNLTAAIYTAREDIETLLLEKGVIGGLAAITDKVDNYPGFAEGIEGLKLSEQLQAQAERFGAKIEFANVTGLEDAGEYRLVKTDIGDFKARAVLIATGSDYKKLGIPGEQEYYGRGVHYCATCDGAFYRDKRLAVVGGGNSAVQEALFLTRFTTHIDLLVRSKIRASEILQHELDEMAKAGKITIHLNTSTDEIMAENGQVTKVVGTKDGIKTDFMVDGAFIFVGLLPNTQFLTGSGIELDERSLIKTDNKLRTNLPGVFCSGDVRSGATMQIASAVGEGATAALNIREFLEGKTSSYRD